MGCCRLRGMCVLWEGLGAKGLGHGAGEIASPRGAERNETRPPSKTQKGGRGRVAYDGSSAVGCWVMTRFAAGHLTSRRKISLAVVQLFKFHE